MSVENDLVIVRNIIRAGIPVVLWKYGRSVPPANWPSAEPDESVIDNWEPKDRLYVVTGARSSGGVDIGDVDPRNGGTNTLRSLKDQGAWPESIAQIATPSGGLHEWFAPLNVRKGRPGQGIDYQAGKLDNVGRGLAAIPPTVGSGTTPNVAYAWLKVPDLTNISEISEAAHKLAAKLERTRPPSSCPKGAPHDMSEEALGLAGEWAQDYMQAKLKKLRELPNKPSKIGTWDETVYGVARDLVRLTNAAWCPLKPDAVYDAYWLACQELLDPANPEWAEHMIDKWDRALVEVDNALAPPPEIQLLIYSDNIDALSDEGNATFFVDRNIADIRYVPQARYQWHVWNGWMWAPDEANSITYKARLALRSLPIQNKEQEKHRNRSLNYGGITACVRLAATDPRILANHSEFDIDPYLLNTPGGVVDLLTGELRDHVREEMHSRVTTVTPEAGPHPLWDKFLSDTFKGNEAELVPFIKKMFGYTISGSVEYDFLPFLYGYGMNGKTVLAQTLAIILGTYAGVAPSGLLTQLQYSHENVKATLFGKRFVVVSEESENAAFNEVRVKEYSGGEPLTARYMHRDFFTWTPTHKIWILANDKPAVNTGGESFWRRVKLIDFKHTVKKEDEITKLEQILVETEGPAILAWAIEGAVQVFRDGLTIPKSAEDSTKEYANEEDHVQRFLDERTESGSDVYGEDNFKSCKKKDLQARYRGWCDESGVKPKDDRQLGRALAKKGIKAGGRGQNQYYGLWLMDMLVQFEIPANMRNLLEEKN